MLGVTVRTFSQDSPAGDSLVLYIPKTGAAYKIRAVFDKAHIAIDAATGAAVNSTDPVLGVQLSQFIAEPRKGDRVQVRETIYRIKEMQPDGVSGATLFLSEDYRE